MRRPHPVTHASSLRGAPRGVDTQRASISRGQLTLEWKALDFVNKNKRCRALHGGACSIAATEGAAARGAAQRWAVVESLRRAPVVLEESQRRAQVVHRARH